MSKTYKDGNYAIKYSITKKTKSHKVKLQPYNRKTKNYEIDK